VTTDPADHPATTADPDVPATTADPDDPATTADPDVPATTAGPPPPARRVLAVVAHPDDESFGLGALLAAYVAAGSDVAVLCLTLGEASTLGAGTPGLAARREAEFAAACDALGARRRWLRTHPDGALASVPLTDLVAEVEQVLAQHDPEVVLVFHPDGITSHPDHRRATEAARAAVARVAVSSVRPQVLAWYVPATVGRELDARFGTRFDPVEPEPADLVVTVDRAAQEAALICHRSQEASLALVRHRNRLLGDREHVRPLPPP
jgi:N-acetylglucosamine malate deacetylase 2